MTELAAWDRVDSEVAVGAAAAVRNEPRNRLLIIERDAQSRETLRTRLALAGFAIEVLDCQGDLCARVRDAIRESPPHLIMLDWDLPGAVTIDLVRQLRSNRQQRIRLVALSTFGGDDHVVESLNLGIDDYVIKPFSVAEIVARVRALLRTNEIEATSDQLDFHGLHLESAAGRVTVKQLPVVLRATELRLLEFFMRHPERAFSRDTLLANVWGRGGAVDARAVDVTVQRLRKALAEHDCSHLLQTVRGLGYRLSAIEPLA